MPLGGAGDAAEDVAAADGHGDLDAQLDHGLHVLGDGRQGLGRDAVLAVAHQRLARELQQDPLVASFRLDGSLAGHGRRFVPSAAGSVKAASALQGSALVARCRLRHPPRLRPLRPRRGGAACGLRADACGAAQGRQARPERRRHRPPGPQARPPPPRRPSGASAAGSAPAPSAAGSRAGAAWWARGWRGSSWSPSAVTCRHCSSSSAPSPVASTDDLEELERIHEVGLPRQPPARRRPRGGSRKWRCAERARRTRSATRRGRREVETREARSSSASRAAWRALAGGAAGAGGASAGRALPRCITRLARSTASETSAPDRTRRSSAREVRREGAPRLLVPALHAPRPGPGG